MRALRHTRSWSRLIEHAAGELPAALLDDADRERSECTTCGYTLLTVLDEGYPPVLQELQHPPLVLFMRGSLRLSYNVAIVGARNCSRIGAETAHRFGEQLTSAGATVISGLAYGIDAAAHRGALSGALSGALGNTLTGDLCGAESASATPRHSGVRCPGVAVLGGGLCELYPREHSRLADQLVELGGAIISEFPNHTPPRGPNFLRRNRLISGLSDTTVVIEAARRSGSLATARFATEQGREVGAVPGSIGSDRYTGSNDLLRQGAHVILESSDILRLAPPHKTPLLQFPSAPRGAPSPLRADVPVHLRRILGALQEEQGTSFDRLITASGYSGTELATHLLELELLGQIQQISGGFYVRNRAVDTS